MQIMSGLFEVHEQALRGRAQQVELIAQNIVNADTPRYKARDIDFKTLLAEARNGPLQTTDQRHFPTSVDQLTVDALRYRVPLNSSSDGNTVEMSVEQAAYGRAAADYSTVLNLIQTDVTEVKRALKGE